MTISYSNLSLYLTPTPIQFNKYHPQSLRIRKFVSRFIHAKSIITAITINHPEDGNFNVCGKPTTFDAAHPRKLMFTGMCKCSTPSPEIVATIEKKKLFSDKNSLKKERFVSTRHQICEYV
jgi:hypothetical protein